MSSADLIDCLANSDRENVWRHKALRRMCINEDKSL
jgi:hypothetical protein